MYELYDLTEFSELCAFTSPTLPGTLMLLFSSLIPGL